jgi:hypothetical protein
MKKRIINPVYSYQNGRDVTIGATLEILSDNDVVLSSLLLSTSQPIDKIGDAAKTLIRGFQEHIDNYKKTFNKVTEMFGAASFDEVANKFINSIDEQVNI